MADIPSHLADALRDRYEFERELGRGGMATVYLARDLKHKRHVALKVLRTELAATLGPDRFRREIETAARLQHPHICSVYDSGEAGGQLWFTMPYVRGESLRARLRRDGRLPVEEALRITAEAGRALDYAHREGFVHRDVKPENLLLTTEGDTLVADFGIVRTLVSAGADTEEHLTQTGVAIGTPAYMAPEQATGEHAVDARADQYALAVTCYEMLAGRPPFTGETPAAVIAQRFTTVVPSVRAARPEVSEIADQALQRALALKPEERFGSMAEFVRGLTAGVASMKPRRVRLVLGALGLAVLAAATATVLGRRSAPPAISTAPAAPVLTRLAVLPFENLGDSADAYFADGVADAVRGKLTALAGLEVIARASSMAYQKTDKSPQEMARELGVRYLLTGTVRWAKARDGASRVQVSPELVEVREAGAPASKWQQPFDTALTDVFQVQADIAGRVAQALDVALGATEQQQLAHRPTADLAAYDAFLKGEAAAQALAALDPPSLRRAVVFYDQAVARDSTFGLAWARVAQAHALLYGLSIPSPAEAEAEAARRALAKAERLAANAPETYRARAGYENLVRHDLARALAAAEAGLARTPDQSELMASAAAAEASLGRVEAAVARLTRARTLDPRSFILANYLGVVLVFQRRWDEARDAIDHTLSLAPTDLTALLGRAMTYLGEGDLAGARRVLAEAPPAVDRMHLAAYLAYQDLSWVLSKEAEQQVLTLPPSAFDDNRGGWALVRAQLHHLQGDRARTRVYADSARIAIEARLRATPGDALLHVSRGLALAYLGRKAEAITEGERGAALLPISRDALLGPSIQHLLVRIYLLVGEPEKALDHLEPLLTMPYYLSPGWLKIDPTFAPLRGNSRFERLVTAK
jgi:eukaryotic-like serine/threonine-protein kinase